MKTDIQPHLHQASSAQAPLLWAWLLALLFALAIMPSVASAQSATCWFENSGGNPINAPAAQSVTMNPITVSLPSNPTAGTPIGNPVSAATAGSTIYIDCGSSSTTGGLSPVYGTYNPANNTIYSPTPGVAFQIQRSGTPIPIYNTGSYNGSPIQFTNTSTFQIFSTGVLPSSGNQIPAGTLLGQWKLDNLCIENPRVGYNFFNGYYYLKSCGASSSAYTFMNFYSGGVTFTASTCSVSAGSQNMTVTLPSVATNVLGTVGATAGTTRFGINLTGCRSGLGVSATLSTGAPYAGASGVISSATGTNYAKGVGIQILKPDGTTPVTFDTAFPTGTTNGTNYTFDLYARYYRTSAPVTPGQVQATATYTLTYQ